MGSHRAGAVILFNSPANLLFPASVALGIKQFRSCFRQSTVTVSICSLGAGKQSEPGVLTTPEFQLSNPDFDSFTFRLLQD